MHEDFPLPGGKHHLTQTWLRRMCTVSPTAIPPTPREQWTKKLIEEADAMVKNSINLKEGGERAAAEQKGQMETNDEIVDKFKATLNAKRLNTPVKRQRLSY